MTDTLATLRVIGSLEGIAADPQTKIESAAVSAGFRLCPHNSKTACLCPPGQCQDAPTAMPAPRIPPGVLEDLRWQAEHPGAVVAMSKVTLRALLRAYDAALIGE